MAVGSVRRHAQLAGVQQGLVETQCALFVEQHIDTPTPLAVHVQVEGVAAGGETWRFQQQIGQLRVDTALGQGLRVERAGVFVRQRFTRRQRGAEGQRQAGQHPAQVWR